MGSLPSQIRNSKYYISLAWRHQHYRCWLGHGRELANWISPSHRCDRFEPMVCSCFMTVCGLTWWLCALSSWLCPLASWMCIDQTQNFHSSGFNALRGQMAIGRTHRAPPRPPLSGSFKTVKHSLVCCFTFLKTVSYFTNVHSYLMTVCSCICVCFVIQLYISNLDVEFIQFSFLKVGGGGLPWLQS